MRAREFTLFFLYLLLALFHREQLGAALVEVTVVEFHPASPLAAGSAWRYAENSEFYDVVPERVRELTAEEPRVVAEAVCASLGGNADMIQPNAAARERVGFNCAFHEPGLSMSADFGDLRRTAANRR